MERIIGTLVLLILLFLILSISRKNNGSGFFAGLIGGIVGGGLLYKLLSGRSSGNSASDVNMGSAETATQQSDSTITDMRERASKVSSGQRPESDAPEPSDLYEAVVNMEEPINAFKLMVESSGRDLEDILQKSKTFLQLRNDEKEKLNTINEALGPGKGIVYKLRQLSGREDVVAGTEDNIANNIINNIESIESAIEEIESNQSNYEDLLSQEEHQLVNDMKQNMRSLKDIEVCIDAISQTSEVEEAISRMTNKAQSHHDLQLTNQEIQKIESTIEQILGMEENIVEKLEELRQIEQQTEKTTQEEINEIKTVLEGANSVENLAQQAWERSDLTENQKNKILEVTEKLKQVLNTLGADLETEEQEEEQIQEEASEAEQEVSGQVDREERELSEAEEKIEAEDQRENQRNIEQNDLVGTFDYLKSENITADTTFGDLKSLSDTMEADGIKYAYSPRGDGANPEMAWFWTLKGNQISNLNKNNRGDEVFKIHYCQDRPDLTGKMFKQALSILSGLGIDFQMKFDEKLFKFQDNSSPVNIVIIYIHENASEEVLSRLDEFRNENNLPESKEYKDNDSYYRHPTYRGFIVKRGSSSE
ncbi:MAG: hypothetical protein R6V35_02265 [Candidatus Nanohaloarchaea archaeon]